jgi:hypothetical protein
LFELITALSNLQTPSTIKTDFEFAAISALQRSLPNAAISGCMFHFGQSIFRKIQSLGLQALYNSDGNVKKFAKSLAALAFVFRDLIEATFFELRNHMDFPVCLV